MKNIIFIACFSLLLLAATFNTTGVKQYRVKRIVIDAGHGGKDPGTHGLVSQEKDIVLDIAHHLGRIIKENMDDVEIIYTRHDDRFIELEQRAELANKNDADLFISIHANALSRSSVYGTETYVMGPHTMDGNLEVAKRENAVIMMEEDYKERYEGFDPLAPESHILFSLYQSAYLNNSLLLADKIERQFKERVGRHSRGVKQAGFWVLWRTSMPSVLVEVGYLTNPTEEKYLNDELGRVYIASGIFRAIRDYKHEIESL
ncbi:MAG: N-acetylmuramoyl-L-alanine amidase [Cyclobacteriaceae bacterium]